MNCTECKSRLYPEDPTQPFFVGAKGRWGNYLPPLCHGCPNKGVESHPSAPQPIREHRPQLDQVKAELLHVHDTLHQLQAMANHLKEKHRRQSGKVSDFTH